MDQIMNDVEDLSAKTESHLLMVHAPTSGTVWLAGCWRRAGLAGACLPGRLVTVDTEADMDMVTDLDLPALRWWSHGYPVVTIL